MKRIGHILFCLLPFLLAEAVQFLISIPVLGITILSILVIHGRSGLSLQQLYSRFLSVLGSSTFTIGLSMLCSAASLILFGIWYHKKLAVRREKSIGRQPVFNAWIILSLILLGLGLQYLSTYLITFIGVLRPDWIQAYEELTDQTGIATPTLLTVFYGCVIAPVSEELIFRGVTLGYAKKAMPAVWAVILQAVLFGVYHMNMLQGIYASMAGLFLGYLAVAGGSLAIPILFHALFNFIGTFAGPYMFYGSELRFFFLFWLTAGVLLTYAGIFLFQHGMKARSQPDFGPYDSPD